ncbi:MAG: homoserine kinase [Eubacteriaceae bacterium]|nr:homoserine kinase [Eubacteriaceae bacterium]
MIKIISKATSANMGPGFDCMGICLGLANALTFEEYDDAIIVNNYADTMKNRQNLIISSFYKASDIIGYSPKGLKLNVKTSVPLSRGLGSSATCITAGVLGAYLLAGEKVDLSEVFQISAKIEGHPDNVSPNIYGGMTLSYTKGDGSYSYIKFNADKKYRFVAMIPDFKLSTEKSRQVLPESYSRQDAVFNVSRTSMLIHALQTGDNELLKDALHDKIHQPYRKSLIKNYDEITTLLLENGAIGTYLSGAGPTIMGIIDNESAYKNISSALRNSEYAMGWNCEMLTVDDSGIEWYTE